LLRTCRGLLALFPLPVDNGETRVDLLVAGHHGDELAADDGSEVVHGDNVGGVRRGHHRRTEPAADRDDMMLASDRDGYDRRHRGVHVETLEIHELEVVFVREHPDSIHIAHALMHRHEASPD